MGREILEHDVPQVFQVCSRNAAVWQAIGQTESLIQLRRARDSGKS
jgi:hypothetical protein